MNPRELIVLTPYRIPAHHALMLSNEDIAPLLHAYSALWHPAALHGGAAVPKIGSPYDYEQPTAGHVYAVPESPPLVQPDDWEKRVRDAGAVVFRATMDRETTLANLRQALQALPGELLTPPHLLDLDPSRAAPFFGIGFGYLMVDALFEAMEHDKLLNATEFWQEIQSAVAVLSDPDPEASRKLLQSAADRLLAAREVVYPVTIHVLDLGFFDPEQLDDPLPAAVDAGQPFNLLAPAALLEKLGAQHPDRLDALRQRVQTEQLEICGGSYLEREDALLPVESQLWNLQHGQAVYKQLLGVEVKVFARHRSAAHPQLPLLLNNLGVNRIVFVPFDDAVMPGHRATIVNWPSPDGKQVEAFCRTPYAADNPQTYFHIAHYLHQTIMQDHGATLSLRHGDKAAPAWYRDWLELNRFAPVLGKWTTFSRYFNDVLAGEYASAASADDFHMDYLTERTTNHIAHPVSDFARHLRWRRRVDTCWTLAALRRSLDFSAPPAEGKSLEETLREREDQVESVAGSAAAAPTNLSPENLDAELRDLEQLTADQLAARLLANAAPDNPGYLVLNPCSFTRRVALELNDFPDLLPLSGPIKASQVESGKAKLVVEVPGLGFAWFPRKANSAATPPAARMRLADSRAVRNEFFEAEIDPATGGLRAIRDQRTRTGRLGQQLVYQPGSFMQAAEVRVTSSGPALGEIITEGAIFDDQHQVLARFRQRFRAWIGRPLLEMRIEIRPTKPPEGYPWHAYFGARFAWRDERASLIRGVNGMGSLTSHNRPMTPDFLELRDGAFRTAIFPGGLPFHQRHGARMLDVILLAEGETAQSFDLAIGLDREQPAQTALGLATPVPLIATTAGPPHVGASGWLFHVDAAHLLLHSLRPAPDGAHAILARFQECTGHGSQVGFRCARDPQRAVMTDVRGN
ncbi:MAG TPA: hypothetical protein VGG61_11605, partial [Gemmataceae bacterium]